MKIFAVIYTIFLLLVLTMVVQSLQTAEEIIQKNTAETFMRKK